MVAIESYPTVAATISGLIAFSRYRERKLIPQFWQHIRTNYPRESCRFADGDIESIPSSPSASMHPGLK